MRREEQKVQFWAGSGGTLKTVLGRERKDIKDSSEQGEEGHPAPL